MAHKQAIVLKNNPKESIDYNFFEKIVTSEFALYTAKEKSEIQTTSKFIDLNLENIDLMGTGEWLYRTFNIDLDSMYELEESGIVEVFPTIGDLINHIWSLGGSKLDEDSDDDENDELAKGNDVENDELAGELIFSISGYGRECIIGTLSNEEADRIIDDEDIEEVLGDVTENDNIIHVYGPDSDDLNITDEEGDEVEFKSIGFEIDIMSNQKGDWLSNLDADDSLLDDIKDNFDGLSLSENFELSNLFIDIKSIYNEEPSEKKILMQQRVEKGYWGDISIPSNLSNENVLLVHLLCEENIPKTVEMLIGYIVYDGENIEFVKLDCDASTEGKSNELIIYDIEEEEILWEV